jgi:hypothetical protein
VSSWLRESFANAPVSRTPTLDLPEPRAADEPKVFIGVDLAQVSDFTAISILEQHGPAGSATYQVRYLERIERGTPYPLIVRHIATVASRPAVVDRATLVVDQTGVGRAIVDLIRAERLKPPLIPVTITSGNEAHRDGLGGWNTPKRDLVSAVQVLLQTQRLRVAAALPAAALLTEELEAFQVKLSPSGMDTYGAWREGSHDDLVLSVALACWAAERGVLRRAGAF